MNIAWSPPPPAPFFPLSGVSLWLAYSLARRGREVASEGLHGRHMLVLLKAIFTEPNQTLGSSHQLTSGLGF